MSATPSLVCGPSTCLLPVTSHILAIAMASDQPAQPPVGHPLAHMTRLSPQAWVCEPDSAAVAAAAARPPHPHAPPALVLFASWMGARDVHIAKYTARYQALYPAAAILVVKFTPAQLWSTAAGRQAVQPAVAYLKAQVDAGVLSPQAPPRLLIHLFSNGGATTMQNLYSAWHQQQQQQQHSPSSPAKPPPPFPSSVAIFDSAPGMPSLRRTYRAFAVSVLPRRLVLRLVMAPLLAAACVLGWLYAAVVMKRLLVPLGLAREDMLSRNFHVLNDASSSFSSSAAAATDSHGVESPTPPSLSSSSPEHVGVIGRQTLRTYIYSKEDDMIGWQHVEQHAADAASGGAGLGGGNNKNNNNKVRQRARIPCRLEMFHGSGHVAHMKHDPERYWRIVADTWDAGSQ
ncbi:DUF829 domain-containing protein [Microdochium nivale]|nr:DUF829 domain-containing protein [Microdochium nivale]